MTNHVDALLFPSVPVDTFHIVIRNMSTGSSVGMPDLSLSVSPQVVRR